MRACILTWTCQRSSAGCALWKCTTRGRLQAATRTPWRRTRCRTISQWLHQLLEGSVDLSRVTRIARNLHESRTILQSVSPLERVKEEAGFHAIAACVSGLRLTGCRSPSCSWWTQQSVCPPQRSGPKCGPSSRPGSKRGKTTTGSSSRSPLSSPHLHHQSPLLL